MSERSPFATFVAGSLENDLKARFDTVAPYLCASVHARLLGRVATAGVDGDGSRPIFWIKDERPSVETQQIISKAYDFASNLFTSKPTVLLSIHTQGTVARPYCVRLTDDFGCAFVPANQLKAEVFVHEISHLCCFSGHPLIDEGIAYYAEDQFIGNGPYCHFPSMSFYDAIDGIMEHDDLAMLSGKEQVAFGRSASRIMRALVEAGIDLSALCATAKLVEPGQELLKLIAASLEKERLVELWGYVEKDSAQSLSDNEIMLLLNGSLGELADEEYTDYGRFLAQTQKLFADPDYDENHATYAYRHKEWESLAQKTLNVGGAQGAVAELYLMIDQALGSIDGAGELWERSFYHLQDALRRYPNDPTLAAVALVYMTKSQLADVPGGHSISSLSQSWQKHKTFGGAFFRLMERLDE